MKINRFRSVSENITACTIELFSNSRVIVTDCKCVVDYSGEYIVLNLGNLNLKITGENLVADSFSFGQTDIKGKIEKLEFI
jgi:hypothetical protein